MRDFELNLLPNVPPENQVELIVDGTSFLTTKKALEVKRLHRQSLSDVSVCFPVVSHPTSASVTVQ